MKKSISTLTLLLFIAIKLFGQSVGSLDGIINVSDLGAGLYSIPIKVPSGINGLQPSLSLEYNSQNGNGIVGVGWNLSGVSAITRASNSIYHDRNVAGVSLLGSDKFSLNGNMLILSTGTYGQASSTYRTEVETFHRIFANGTIASSPQMFTVVDDENGLIYEYGLSSGSRVIMPNTSDPIMWLLERVSDLHGNRMNYSYIVDPGEEPRINNITYSMNIESGYVPRTQVSFFYDGRPDDNFTYIAGSKLRQQFRLIRIDIEQRYALQDWTGVNSYSLVYEDDFYSKLVQIIQKGHELNGSPEELPATTFSYGTIKSPTEEIHNAGAAGTGADEIITGDFNGDGRSDFVRFPKNYVATNNSWEVFLNNGTGYNSVQSHTLPPPPSSSMLLKLYPNIGAHQRSSTSSAFDFNGDGKDDFFYRDLEFTNPASNIMFQHEEYSVFLSNGNSLNQLSNKKIVPHSGGAVVGEKFDPTYPLVGDFDGDGKTEILVLRGPHFANIPISYSFSYNYLIGEEYLTESSNYLLPKQLLNMPFDAQYVGPQANKILVVDYDGDGKSEILTVWQQPWGQPVAAMFRLNVVFDANNKPVVGDPAFIHLSTGDFPTIAHQIFPGDFNGDGITDMLTWKQNEGWLIGYGNGKGFITDIQTAPSMNMPVVGANVMRPITISDFNGDGKSDIFDYTPAPNSYNWGAGHNPRIHYSRGNNVFQANSFSLNTGYWGHFGDYYWTGDFNGDGAADIYTKWYTAATISQISFNPHEDKNLLQKITNGLGEETKIEYKSLTNSQVYSSGSNSYAYPFIKRTLPLKVVSSVFKDNGIDKAGNKVDYYYVGVKFNAHGKGLLGFDLMTINDQITSIKTTKTFHVNLDYAFSHPLSMWNETAGNITDYSIYNYQFYDYGNKRIFPYTSSTETYDYLSSVQIDKVFNYVNQFAIGKPSSIQTTIGGGQEVILEEFVYPQFFVGGSSPSLAFRPLSIKKTITRSGMQPYARLTRFDYDNITARINNELSDPNTSNQKNTSYTYNGYGNITTKVMSSNGLLSRTENYLYDASNRYLTKTFNSAFPNVASVRSYHPITNTLTSETSADGYVVSYTYDGFGRPTSVTDNNGKVENYSLHWVNQGIGKYFKRTTKNTTSETTEIFDRLNRNIKNEYPGFNGGIQTFTNYNIKGQISKTSMPTLPSTVPLWTELVYDIYGRLVEEQRPQGTALYSFTSTGGGIRIAHTNTAGQTTITQKDLTGKTRYIEDNIGQRTNYVYHSNGGVQSVDLSSTGTVYEIIYDAFGRKEQVIDQNFNGSYKYNYNAYDEIVSSLDPQGNNYDYTYNQIGQMLTKTGTEGIYNYIYESGLGTNCGKLIQVSQSTSGVTHTYSYGTGNKVNVSELTSGSQIFRNEFTYDGFGRINSRKFPNNVIVEYGYNSADGSIDWIGRPGNSIYVPTGIYSVINKNRLGQITEAGYKSQFYSGTIPNPNYPSPFYGFTNYQEYDEFGLLMSQRTATPSNITLRNYSYGFNPTSGNLQWRNDDVKGLQENFNFDNLNRLAQMNGPSANESLTYSENGNIEQKTDAGSFVYDQANRVTEIEPHTNIAYETQQVTYTPFNKVESITENPWEAQFKYWADGERRKMEITQNGALHRTVDYAPQYEQETDAISGDVKQRCYIHGPDGNLVVVIENINGTELTNYVLTDHLGSVTQVLNASGTIIEEKSYDAWGRLRDPQTWAAYPSNMALGQPAFSFNRGYTGHEHLPEFGIINMNGRLYDPVMGRMFSPDPFIQQMDNGQNFNRYSYCFNNPLKYTDPSGNLFVGFLTTLGADFARTIFTKGGLEFWNWNKGYVQNAWRGYDPSSSWSQSNKALRIDLGAFKTDRSRTVAGNIGMLISRFTWEHQQTEWGNTFSHIRNALGMVDDVSYYGGATLVNGNSDGLRWGVTLGGYINGQNMQADPYTDDLFRHEYGHTLQSRMMGPMYNGFIAPQSLVGSLIHGNEGHGREWYETQANRMALRYFQNHDGNSLVRDPITGRGMEWNFNENPTNYNPNRYWFITQPTFPIYFWASFF